MMGNPSTRRTERITKQSDEPNWRSQKWEKPILEVESPLLASKTKMSIKLENDDKQNHRSRLKQIIRQRIESQSIAQTQTPFIEEMELDEEDQEIETEEEFVETTEEQEERRRLIHAYLTSTMEKEGNREEQQNNRRELLHAYSKFTMDNDNKQTEQDKTETYLRTSMEE